MASIFQVNKNPASPSMTYECVGGVHQMRERFVHAFQTPTKTIVLVFSLPRRRQRPRKRCRSDFFCWVRLLATGELGVVSAWVWLSVTPLPISMKISQEIATLCKSQDDRSKLEIIASHIPLRSRSMRAKRFRQKHATRKQAWPFLSLKPRY